MANPLPLLLAGGAALLLLSGKKKPKPKSKDKKNGTAEELPAADDELPDVSDDSSNGEEVPFEELPAADDELPDVSDDSSNGEEVPLGNGAPSKAPKIDPFVPDEPQDDDVEPDPGNISVFPPSYTPSVSVPGNTLYIDPAGEGYAIGNDFVLEISIKGKKYSPAAFFEEFTPDEDPINSWQVYPAPATADFYVSQLMKVWASASGASSITDQMPGSGGMKGMTKLQYFNAWLAFAEKYPVIAALFFDLQEKVGFDMMMKLYETNKDKYQWVFMHYHAENALIDHWDEPVADITDIAYKATWPSAPEKIKSSKDPWAKKWNTMLEYVNNLRTQMATFLGKSSGELPSWRYIEDVVDKQLGL